MAATARLRAEDLSVSYSRTPVLNSLSTDLPDGALTVIVGPNACGKSTLLRALARLQPAGKGQVLLDGKAIHRQGSRAVAQRLAILPQTPTAPEGLTVRDLATRGRTPHQSPLRQWSRQDAEAVTRALDLTHMAPHVPEPGIAGIQSKGCQQLFVVLGPAGLEHLEILVLKPVGTLGVNRVERIHQTVAKGIGIDIKRRMDKMRNIGPEGFIAVHGDDDFFDASPTKAAAGWEDF